MARPKMNWLKGFDQENANLSAAPETASASIPPASASPTRRAVGNTTPPGAEESEDQLSGVKRVGPPLAKRQTKRGKMAKLTDTANMSQMK